MRARGPRSRRDLVASLLGLAVGLGVCAHGIGLTVGTPLAPEPGFFPLLSGVLLVSLAILLLGQSLLPSGSHEAQEPYGRLRAPALLSASLVVYAFLLEFCGYPLLTTLLTLLILRVLETSWVPALVASVLLALGSFGLFVQLGVPLPIGQVFLR